MILALRALLGILAQMEAHHLKELRDTAHGKILAEKIYLTVLQQRLMFYCNLLSTMAFQAEAIEQTSSILLS